ncbi:MAG: response regulator [Myxococcota bacterium]
MDPKATAPEQPPLILVVDPDDASQDALEGFLIDLFGGRCRVHRTASAEQALDVLRAFEVSVLISEEALPGMSGIGMFRQARTLQPDAVRVLLTESMNEGALVEAINTGRVFRYLPKPWPRPELEECIRNALDWRQHGRAMRELLDEQRRTHLALAESLSALEQTQQHMVHVERLATVGRLTSGIIHEVRNQLTALLGVFATLRVGEGQAGELAMEGYRVVKRLITRMGSLEVFARAGGWTYEMEDTPVSEFVDELRGVYALEIGEPQLPVDVGDGICERRFRMDLSKLVHAVLAVTRDAQARFRTPLRLQVDSPRGGGLHLRLVFDRPEEVRRAEGSAATPPTERDPSLEVVRMIVDAHEGTVELDPADAPGIWAHLTIPA